MSTDGKAPSSTQTQDGGQEWTRLKSGPRARQHIHADIQKEEPWEKAELRGLGREGSQPEPSSTWVFWVEAAPRSGSTGLRQRGLYFSPCPLGQCLCSVQPASGPQVILDTVEPVASTCSGVEKRKTGFLGSGGAGKAWLAGEGWL